MDNLTITMKLQKIIDTLVEDLNEEFKKEGIKLEAWAKDNNIYFKEV